MIEGVILDIDGVIVGQSPGKNFPLPHPDVLAALKQISTQVKFVSFCTAKPLFAITKLIQASGLHNVHIGSGGAELLSSTGTGKIIALPRQESIELIALLDKEQIFTEVYAATDYFIRTAPAFGVEKMHADILERKPKIVKQLKDVAINNDISKIMPVAYDDADKVRISALLEPFKDSLFTAWTVHPVALPYQFCVVTAQGVSKGSGATEIAAYYDVPLENVLAVGDSTSDWEFIKLCGYKSAMGNASEQLKTLVLAQGKNVFIGGSVEQNGVIDIFKHFTLLE